MLAHFDQKKKERNIALQTEKDERELILNSGDEGNESGIIDPAKARKIVELKKKHEKMMLDLNNPEKKEEMKKKQKNSQQ